MAGPDGLAITVTFLLYASLTQARVSGPYD
jgi:hypothetical protein